MNIIKYDLNRQQFVLGLSEFVLAMILFGTIRVDMSSISVFGLLVASGILTYQGVALMITSVRIHIGTSTEQKKLTEQDVTIA